MAEIKTCSICKVAMEKDRLFSNNSLWTSAKSVLPIVLKPFFGKIVFAYRCPQCKKVELYTDS